MKKLFIVMGAVLLSLSTSACSMVSVNGGELIEKITESYDKDQNDVAEEFDINGEADELGMLLMYEDAEIFGENGNTYLNFDISTDKLYGMQSIYTSSFDVAENLNTYSDIYSEIKSLYGEANFADFEEYVENYYPIMDKDEAYDYYEKSPSIFSEWSLEIDGEERILYLKMDVIEGKCTITVDYRMAVYLG